MSMVGSYRSTTGTITSSSAAQAIGYRSRLGTTSTYPATRLRGPSEVRSSSTLPRYNYAQTNISQVSSGYDHTLISNGHYNNSNISSIQGRWRQQLVRQAIGSHASNPSGTTSTYPATWLGGPSELQGSSTLTQYADYAQTIRPNINSQVSSGYDHALISNGYNYSTMSWQQQLVRPVVASHASNPLQWTEILTSDIGRIRPQERSTQGSVQQQSWLSREDIINSQFIRTADGHVFPQTSGQQQNWSSGSLGRIHMPINSTQADYIYHQQAWGSGRTDHVLANYSQQYTHSTQANIDHQLNQQMLHPGSTLQLRSNYADADQQLWSSRSMERSRIHAYNSEQSSYVTNRHASSRFLEVTKVTMTKLPAGMKKVLRWIGRKLK